MYRFRLAAAGCAFTLLGAASVGAQTPAAAADTRPRIDQPEFSRRAISRLFQAPPPTPAPSQPWTPPAFAVPNSARRFHCLGMPVLPADPRLDATFEKWLPVPDRTTRFTMQVIRPTCY